MRISKVQFAEGTFCLGGSENSLKIILSSTVSEILAPLVLPANVCSENLLF